MKKIVFILSLLATLNVFGNFAIDQFVDRGQKIEVTPIKAWPLLHNGRIKPFETLAQEMSLFVTGKYKFKGLHPVQFVMASMASPNAQDLEVIEVRSPEVRKLLGLPEGRRHYSAAELRKAKLYEIAGPLAEKDKANKQSVTETEKKTIEAMEQAWVYEQVATGSMLIGAMNPQLQTTHAAKGEAPTKGGFSALLGQVVQAANQGIQLEYEKSANEISQKLAQQPWPEEIRGQLANVKLEILYNSFKPFRWACWIFLALSLLLLQGQWIKRTSWPVLNAVLLIPILFLTFGFFLRVKITGFAPVTNMYGTMLWVSLGIGLFGWCFRLIYRHARLLSLLYFGAFILLILTEQMPLIISPDMDPIVAVLRSNLWLTIHVLTITISYAAFSLAMLMGNATMIRYIAGGEMKEWVKTYSHFCYRAIQLGVFLLSVGIILGGVWADYSWGRFWGWDPKETWSLIADLGYLVLLHSRFVGWVTPFRLLILSPVAYLLVIMAWYGVNFILATGLHSYGFSSGGAQIVTGFIIVQMLLFGATLLKGTLKSQSPV